MNFTLYFLIDLKSRIEESRSMELDQQKNLRPSMWENWLETSGDPLAHTTV